MEQGSNSILTWAQIQGGMEPRPASGPVLPPGRRAKGAAPRRRWFSEPKSAIWIALAAVVLIGGGRKLVSWWQARKAVARLGEPDVVPEEIEAVAEHGRAGVGELLRIFSTCLSEPVRQAAGCALARLWLLDQLVAEEEQAVVRRGYTVTWRARRRYPRALDTEIPIAVTYEVPFLEDGGERVGPANLEWSHRVLGARRAATEEFSPWMAGRGRVAFTIFPGDFETVGPHRLVLQTRVRTAGLTDSWEIALPHVPFSFEFDPILQLSAILTLPDAARDDSVARAIRLEPAAASDGNSTTYLSIGDQWMLKSPPQVTVALPLPCDLAHKMAVEFEGVEGRFPGGTLIVSGQGAVRSGSADEQAMTRRVDLAPFRDVPQSIIERAGSRRLRIWLEADPAAGWADPEIRSIWPGRTQTNWIEVDIVRR